MADVKYTPMKNNPNFMVNNTKKQEEIKFTIEISKNKSYDSEYVEIIPAKSPQFSNIAVIFAGDVHDGAVGTNAVKDEKTLEFVRKTANCIYVPGGDVFNSVISPDQDRHADKYGLQHAIDKKHYQFEKILDKIPFVIDGNHDGQNGSRWVASGMSPAKHLADSLNITHIKYGALLQLTLPSSDYKREPKTINLFMFHCAGKTSGTAKSVDNTFKMAMAQLQELKIVPDAIFGGHFHSNSNGLFPTDVYVYNKSGKLVGIKRKDVIVVSDSTLQEKSDYALAAGYPPTESNVYINNIRVVKNPYYNASTKNTQYEYMVEMTRIPMFRQNSDEYTDEAKEYMKNYQEPEHLREEVRREYQNISYEEATKKLKEAVDDFKSARFLFDETENVSTQTFTETKTESLDANAHIDDDVNSNDGM